MTKHKRNHRNRGLSKGLPAPAKTHSKEFEPDWTKKCEVCGETPVVPKTGMCGPCTFGEAETVGGNW
jgi:hypothetical protein